MVFIWTKKKSLPDERPLTWEDLPIPIGVRSNGEYLRYPSARERAVAAKIIELATRNAKRLGMDRRAFLQSSAGMATALVAINSMAGCNGGAAEGSSSSGSDTTGSTGMGSDTTGTDTTETGPFETTGTDEGCDADGSRELLSNDDQFVLDAQTHHIELGGWQDTNKPYRLFYDELLAMSQPGCNGGGADCFVGGQYRNMIYEQSDTTVAVLSGLPAIMCEDANPGEYCGHPIDDEGMAASRDAFNELAASQRMINHAMVVPNFNLDLALAGMEQAVASFGVSAWKMYTPWGQLTAEQIDMLDGLTDLELIAMAATGQLKGEGWELDDPNVGIPVIEKGLELGVDIFCCHKGLPLPTFDPAHTSARDLAVVATMYPEAKFIAYHSSLNAGAMNFLDNVPEGPYDGPDADPAYADKGVNDLIKAMLDNDLAPGSNVYAELGGVWSSVMADAEEAQHVIGKLLKYVGEDNILWGTDAIWVGTPQPLIEAFRAFSITPEFQDMYGYPELTAAIKDKILGLNAAAVYGVDPDELRCTLADDEMANMRRQYREARIYEPRRRSAPMGPRSRREFIRLFRADPHSPG